MTLHQIGHHGGGDYRHPIGRIQPGNAGNQELARASDRFQRHEDNEAAGDEKHLDAVVEYLQIQVHEGKRRLAIVATPEGQMEQQHGNGGDAPHGIELDKPADSLVRAHHTGRMS